MVLSPGGPTVSGSWFFTDISPYPLRHTLGSLNWWRGMPDAVFPGVGEVARHAWRDGSPLPCAAPPPPPVCLHVEYLNYNIVEASLDGGSTWFFLPTVSAQDTWEGTRVLSGTSWKIKTVCGLLIANSQGVQIQKTAGGPIANYGSESHTSTYPATWTMPTVAANPPTWPGGDVMIRTRCDDSIVTAQSSHGSNVATRSLTPGGTSVDGDSYVVAYFQNGTDGSGGPLQAPTISPSSSPVFAATSKRFYLWFLPNQPHSTTVTLSGLSKADLCDMYLITVRTRPSASIVASVFREAVASATVLTSNAMTFSGDAALVLAFFNQFRQSAVSQGATSFSTPTGGLTLDGQLNNVFVSGTPVFESLGDCRMSKQFAAAGTYTAGVTSNRSLSYNSAILAIR